MDESGYCLMPQHWSRCYRIESGWISERAGRFVVLISPFQLFTNGQRQFAQKVDTGNDPETIFFSFRLRNPEVADVQAEKRGEFTS